MKKYLLILLLTISLQSFSQNILYVDKDATGLNDGTSWANAFVDLQDALALDASGDQIWIADGTYIPGASRSSTYTFNVSNVTLYGGFNGTESSLSERDFQTNKTILSGDLLDNDAGLFSTASNTKFDNAYHVVMINANDVGIDGVVITKGVATGGASSQKVGAGIYVFDNSAGFQIRNCEFTLNTSWSGSGIRANINANTTVKIENCNFNNNIAGTNGAGIFMLSKVNRTVNIEITNCLFENNYINDQITTGASGTAILISSNENNSTINTTITNCTFANNFENTSASVAEKAVINVGKRFADPNFVHNITVSNSIFYNNVDASGSVVGSIGRGNLQAPNGITVYNSLDQDVFTYVNPANLFNTLNSNPLFADMANNLFTLQTGSPAIDAGDNSKIPAGVTTDLAGNQRILNSTVDIGAYEFDPSAPVQRILTLNATNGSITPDLAPTNGTYDNGSVVELTAVPDAGYQFDGWSGDATGTTNPISVTLDANKTVTANFILIQRTLTLNATNGSITPDVTPTNGTYDNGTVVELTAVPDAGYQFDGWSGDATGTANPISVTLDADKTVTANFSPIQRTLSLNATNGSITADVAPTNGTYDNGTVVELTAVPDAGYQFDGWSGDATGSTNPISVTLDADKTVTANFSPIQRTLSLNATNGSITPDVAPTNGTYDNGTVVELTAVPDAGYQFDGWSGDATGTTNPLSVTLDGDKTVTANFSPIQRTLTLNATNGSITPDVAPTNGTYDNGTVVELTAVPDAGYQFDGWSGDATGTTNPISVTLDADKTVTANFSPLQRTLSLNATNGSITVDVASTNGTYDNGTVVELTAVPDAGYQFDGWSGDATGTTNPLSVTLDADKTVTANFSPIQRTLSLNATNGSITADVAPTNGTYDNGTVVELTAVPDAGYQFDGWSGDVTGTTNPLSVTLDADKTVTANFSPIQRTLSLNATNGSITADVAPTNGTYDNGTVVELTAVPDAGYQFDGWSGDATGTTNPISVTMDADKTVTALITLIDNRLSQTINFDPLAAKVFGDEAFELSATASSGLSVSFSSSNEAVATIDGTTVNIIGAGTTIITASQSGDDEYTAAAEVSRELVVNKADQSITIEEISDKDIAAEDFEVIASVSSELGLSYNVLSGPATITGNIVSLNGNPGTVEIEVSQAGTANYNAASATTTFEVVEDPCISFASIATVVQNVSCNGAANGSFEVAVTNGTAPFTYNIGGESQDNGLFENQSAGNYEITVTDANGCSAVATVEITEPRAIEVTAEITDSNSINGNGSISLTASGGSGNFTFEWSNGATTSSLTDLEIGEYTVTVTDEIGCSITESYTIGGVTANREAFEIKVYPNPVIDQVKIVHGEKVNQISLIDANGRTIKMQHTIGNESQFDMKGLQPGLYFIRMDNGKMNRIIKQ